MAKKGWTLEEAVAFSRLLRELFEERWPQNTREGWNQGKWAEACGVSRPMLSKILSLTNPKIGKTSKIEAPSRPEEENLQQIARALSASLPEQEYRSIYDRLLTAANYSLLSNKRNSEVGFILENVGVPDYIREGVEADIRTLKEGWIAYNYACIDLYQRNWEKIIERGKRYSQSLTMSRHLLAYWLDISAIAQLHLGEIKKAESLLKEHQVIQDVLHCEDYHHLRASILLHLGDVAREQGKWAEAKRRYDEAWKILDDNADLKVRMRAERKQASIQLYQGDWQNNVQMRLEGCLNRFKEFSDNYEVARTHQNLGWVCEMAGNWKQAREHREKALMLAEQHRIGGKHSDKYLITMSLTHLGSDYRQRGELEAAEKQISAALELAQTIKAKRYEGYAYLELAHIYRLKGLRALRSQHTARERRGDGGTAEAVRYFEKAQKNAEQGYETYPKIYRYHRALALGVRSKLFVDASEYLQPHTPDHHLASAKGWLDEAIPEFNELGCHYHAAQARVYLCELYLKRSDSQGIAKEVAAIEALHKQYSYLHLMAQARMIQAKEAAQRKQMREAVQCCADALDYAGEFNEFVLHQMEDEFDQVVRSVIQHENVSREEVDFLTGNRSIQLTTRAQFVRYFCSRVAEALQAKPISPRSSIEVRQQREKFVKQIRNKPSYL